MAFHEAYLGKRLQDFLALAHEQMRQVYEANDLVIPVEGSSTLQVLAPGENLSLTEIARQLGQSHQLIAQRIGKLQKLGLVEKHPDPDDGRRAYYNLTTEGEIQWHRLDALMVRLASVNAQLFDDIGCDLTRKLDEAMQALASTPYLARFDPDPAEAPIEEISA